MMHQYSSIQQIFYGNKKYGAKELFDIQRFCLTNALFAPCEFSDQLEKSDCIDAVDTPISPPKIDIIEGRDPPPKFLIPKQQDTLFWCVFISVNGLGEYYQVGHSYGNRILEEKMKIANWIKSCKKTLKTSNYKFTNELIEETMSEFMVDKCTSFNGLAALALYYKRNIFVLDEKRKLYMKFLSPDTESEDSDTMFIYYHDYMRGEYKYKIRTDENTIQINREQFFCLENVYKPLKPISTYKVDDLLYIANILGLHIPDKMKKQELYNMVSEKCNWYGNK